ncbi:hypothetical protein DB43_EY00090 [Parachlamydia acanthamoebae]|uniref:Transposase n=1 Tax=Parachlamydia acanthamoebae TaxID=83552 RepID=A0A0C1EP76_9BACT|nr:hypothetical protein DB43_EY00090 [Parachlamydia acanthamoebae]
MGKIFKYLAADADNEYGMIDSTIVRAYQRQCNKKGNAKTKPQERAKEG